MFLENLAFNLFIYLFIYLQQLLAEASSGPGRGDAPTEYERRPPGTTLARTGHFSRAALTAVAEVRDEARGQPGVRRERET